MLKLLFGFLVLVFLTLTAFPVSAIQTFGELKVDQDIRPVLLDSGSVTFIVTAERDVFDTSGQIYSYITWRDGESRFSCAASGAQQTTTDPRRITFTSTITGCRAEVGTWHFVMWRGSTSLGSTDDGNILVPDYVFSVEQAGGGVLDINPVRTPLGLSENPQVRLINARSDNAYEFWWDGSHTEWAAKYTATTDGNFTIDLVKNGVDFNEPGKKKLCMEIGDDANPGLSAFSSVTCRYSTEFEFTALPPPPPTVSPTCSIEPASPTQDDSVSIRGSNFPQNQNFRADLIVAGQTINLPTEQNSGSDGTVFLQLASHLTDGDYSAKIYSIDNQLMCELDFRVGPPTENGKPAARECTDADQKAGRCTLGSGARCGPDNDPAIKTAIGCLRTSPAGFVKDFLKFALAISGGLAFLLMVLGAFQMLTSAGNPDTLNAGRERFSSAIIGLLFIIFAVLLLQIIGVNILGIEGFSR